MQRQWPARIGDAMPGRGGMRATADGINRPQTVNLKRQSGFEPKWCAALLLAAALAARAGDYTLEFDGATGYVTIPHAAHYNVTTALTAEIWFKTTAAKDQMPSAKWGTEGGWYWGLRDSGNSVRVRLNTESANASLEFSLPAAYTDGEWHHLAFTYDGSQVIVYYDGAALTPQAYANGNIKEDAGVNVNIASYRDGTGWFFDGRLADARLWNTVRTAAGIQREMNWRLRGDEEGLIGYWPLDEGNGEPGERTAYANDGERTAAAAWQYALDAPIGWRMADPVTGSTRFTHTNTVAVADFPIPEGYDRYQIRDPADPPPSGELPGDWQPTSSPPTTVVFAWPAEDGPVFRQAWFTNASESVPLGGARGAIVHTTQTPTPVAIAGPLQREIVPGGFTIVTPADLDAGSTGGEYDGVDLEVFGRSVILVSGPGGDATPAENYVTLTNTGTWQLALRVVNEANLAADSSNTIDVVVTEAAPPAGQRFVLANNPHAQWPYDAWPTAAATLEDAIDAAAAGQTVVVWKTVGVVPSGAFDTGARTAPSGGTLASNRLVITNGITVLAASIDPADTVIRGRWHDPAAGIALGTAAIRPVWMDAGTTLAGFTIEDGGTHNVNNDNGYGGGIWSAHTSATVSNCVLRNNRARHRGGGVYQAAVFDSLLIGNRSGSGGGASSAELVRCRIVSNRIEGSSSYYGGGVHASMAIDSDIIGNRGSDGGGAHSSTLIRCRVLNNTASSRAASTMSTDVYNSLIAHGSGGYGGNPRGIQGGTLYNSLIINSGSSRAIVATLYNCTVVGHSGTALRSGSTVYNSIVYNNNSNYETGVTFYHSCTSPAEDGWDPSNISASPQFVDPAQGDYRLRLRPVRSPGIETAAYYEWMIDPTDVRSRDLQGNSRISLPWTVGGRPDMGAYEYSYRGTTLRLR